VVLLAAATLSLGAAALESSEPPLPGFEPVRVSGRTIELDQRRYVWEDSLLPIRLESLGRWLAGPMQLEVRTPSGTLDIAAVSARVGEHGDSRAIVVASSNKGDGIELSCNTTVEYDGVAFADCAIGVDEGVAIEQVRYRVTVDQNAYTRLLPYKAPGIRSQRKQSAVTLPRYDGDYLSAFGLADGDRSFWWFCDDRGEHFEAPGSETIITPQDGKIALDQRVLGSVRGPGRFSFRFGFLATPIRQLGTQWRIERVVAGQPSKRERALGGRYFLWWPTTFAHDMLPLLDFPAETSGQLRPEERALFPGAAANRALVAHDLRAFGIHRLAYGSVRVVSVLDPIIAKNRKQWEVEPPYVFRGTHNPYRQRFEKPTFSHRVPEFSDFLLERWNAAIGALGVSGAYLDNGFPVDTLSPVGGCRSARSGYPCTDIEGTRRFLERFRRLFLAHGKPGYLFVHASAREVIPTYTFVTSLIDGEQYRKGLDDGDYMGSLSLDEVRTRFSPHQYGILNTWLNVAWSYHKNDRTQWRGSESQRRATRSFMGMALLHDIPMWMADLHPEERSAVLGTLDRFGVERAEFRGYWQRDAIAETSTPDAAISAYLIDRGARALLVVANLHAQPRPIDIQLHPDRLGANASVRWTASGAAAGDRQEIGSSGRFQWRVPGHDFALIELSPRSDGDPHRD